MDTGSAGPAILMMITSGSISEVTAAVVKRPEAVMMKRWTRVMATVATTPNRKPRRILLFKILSPANAALVTVRKNGQVSYDLCDALHLPD